MRLDIWLVEQGFFSSRQRAKRAIRAGKVLVNGSPAKPSTKIQGEDKITVLDYADRPLGYYKLMSLEKTLGHAIVNPGFRVLDIGSSAGGFLLYLHERGAHVTGIEISCTFAKHLSHLTQSLSNVEIIFGDAFRIDPREVGERASFDVLLVDVTTNVSGTLQIIKRYYSLLRCDGLLIAAFKAPPLGPQTTLIESQLRELKFEGVRTVVLDRQRSEIHAICRKHCSE